MREVIPWLESYRVGKLARQSALLDPAAAPSCARPSESTSTDVNQSGTTDVLSHRRAQVCGEYLYKGRHVYIEGRLQTRKWSDREGDKRTTVEVVANQMRILDRAPKNGNGMKPDESPKASGLVEEGDNPFNEPDGRTIEQETPF